MTSGCGLVGGRYGIIAEVVLLRVGFGIAKAQIRPSLSPGCFRIERVLQFHVVCCYFSPWIHKIDKFKTRYGKKMVQMCDLFLPSDYLTSAISTVKTEMWLWENMLNVTAKLLCDVYTFFIVLFPVEWISLFLTVLVSAFKRFRICWHCC